MPQSYRLNSPAPPVWQNQYYRWDRKWKCTPMGVLRLSQDRDADLRGRIHSKQIPPLFHMHLNAYVAKKLNFPAGFRAGIPISCTVKDTVMANRFLTGKWQCCHVETWASSLCVVLCLSRMKPLANCNWICADQSSLDSCPHQAQGQASGQSIGNRPRAQNFIYHPVSFTILYPLLFFLNLCNSPWIMHLQFLIYSWLHD